MVRPAVRTSSTTASDVNGSLKLKLLTFENVAMVLSLSLLPVLLASADDTPCGAAQWAAYWRTHLNATTVPPRACAYVPGYSCCSDENWWPKVICRSHAR
jgi:hypothetical protein